MAARARAALSSVWVRSATSLAVLIEAGPFPPLPPPPPGRRTPVTVWQPGGDWAVGHLTCPDNVHHADDGGHAERWVYGMLESQCRHRFRVSTVAVLMNSTCTHWWPSAGSDAASQSDALEGSFPPSFQAPHLSIGRRWPRLVRVRCKASATACCQGSASVRSRGEASISVRTLGFGGSGTALNGCRRPGDLLQATSDC